MKLTYFNLYARAEAIRMLMTHNGTEFTDERIEFADWPTLKATIPSGQVPLLTTSTGEHLNQSVPILRYLGATHGYYNVAEPMQAYKADQTISTVDDHFIPAFYKVFMSADAASEEEIKERVAMHNKLCTLL